MNNRSPRRKHNWIYNLRVSWPCKHSLIVMIWSLKVMKEKVDTFNYTKIKDLCVVKNSTFSVLACNSHKAPAELAWTRHLYQESSVSRQQGQRQRQVWDTTEVALKAWRKLWQCQCRGLPEDLNELFLSLQSRLDKCWGWYPCTRSANVYGGFLGPRAKDAGMSREATLDLGLISGISEIERL